MTTTLDLTHELDEQLHWHWTNQLRPRLHGLSDAEYLWEPVEGCWSLREDPAAPSGLTIDFAHPAPEPPPVTTLAWRLVHVTLSCFAMRNASHFGAKPVDYASWPYTLNAQTALAQLDEQYAIWRDGVRGLDAAALARPCGPAEGPFGDLPMATLVLHINREVIHHGAEMALLRDLYRHEVSEGHAGA